jgi:hypothetical protein
MKWHRLLVQQACSVLLPTLKFKLNKMMNTATKVIAAALIGTALYSPVRAQDVTAKDVRKQKGYTLTFEGNDPSFSPALKEKLIKTFFIVYPKLEKEYNPKTAKVVTFKVDTAYDGVAATANDQVVFSPAYMAKHPGDIDVVTHEVMHIVQNYGDTEGPGWLTEGIADYARNQFGVDNAGAKWTLPDYKAGQSYENSYRITARFLVWIERKVKAGTVKVLDKSLRDQTYTAGIWAKQTGKDLDTLWAQYISNPAI